MFFQIPVLVMPDRHTDRQTHTHTLSETNYRENITPPGFRGGVKKKNDNERKIRDDSARLNGDGKRGR